MHARSAAAVHCGLAGRRVVDRSVSTLRIAGGSGKFHTVTIDYFPNPLQSAR